MDRNTIIAILLVFLIWTVWPMATGKKSGLEKAPTQSHSVVTEKTNPVPTAATSTVTSSAKTAVQSPSPVVERVLENELVRVLFDSRFASARRVELKHYTQKPLPESPLVNLAFADENFENFALLMDEGDGPNVVDGWREVSFSQANREVVYEKSLPSGLLLRRTLRLDEKSYNIFSDVEFRNPSAAVLRPQAGFRWRMESAEKLPTGMKRFLKPPEVFKSEVLLNETKREDMTAKAGESKEQAGAVTWYAMGSRYFLSALLPMWDGSARVFSQTRMTSDQRTVLENSIFASQLKLLTGDTYTLKARFFVGPKDLKILEKEGSHLERALNFGFFEFFARGLLRLMQFFHGIFGNWGLSIIALTLLVKLLFFPLAQKSFKSMKEMQKIQPLLQDVRERHKDDREKLNLETMRIMREHKVNPLGGCLPMLVQLPIYFALYQVFYNAIELRQAPFYLWIKDLSVPDPYFVSPVLMGVSMFLQQKLSPKPTDPMQAQMMMIMPIMFSFFMVVLPSGLVIYIFFNTMFSVAQQWHVNRSLGMPLGQPQTA